MITFLSSPKAWSGIAARHQEYAICNWLSLHPENEVILYGDAPGTSDACKKFGARHVPDIKSTPAGIPFFDAIVEHSAVHGTHDLQIYLNCDILLKQDLLDVAVQIPWKKFLGIGQRIDLPDGEPQILEQVMNEEWLRGLAQNGSLILHPPAGSDYFLFSRGMWKELPPIIIGRGGYDNALIAWCLQNKIPVLDATFRVTALHQHHGYGHAKGGINEVFHGQEAASNLSLCKRFGGIIPTLEDATWIFQEKSISKSYGRGDWIRGILDRHLWQIPNAFLRRLLVRIWGKLRLMKLSRPMHVDLRRIPALAGFEEDGK